MSIRTKAGDRGTTSLLCGMRRVPKTHPQILATHRLEGVSIALGRCHCHTGVLPLRHWLRARQARLIHLMGEVAYDQTNPESYVARGFPAIAQGDIVDFEQFIDYWEYRLPKQRTWVLAGHNLLNQALHEARLATREAEIALHATGASYRPELGAWLNAFSDALYLLARAAEHFQEADLRAAFESRPGLNPPVSVGE